MDAEQHELHARFYLDGNCYEPEVAALLPESLHHEIARHQMGRKVTVDFPDAWRANLVEVAPERTSQPAR